MDSNILKTVNEIRPFISFEGMDGSGKTTQINLITSYLQDIGIKFECLREPGGTLVSEKIRDILLNKALSMTAVTELLLFYASRAQLVNEKILPLLENNTFVILDRFFDSSIAYQGYGRGLPLELLSILNHYSVGPIIPEKTIFIDIPFEVSRQRTFARGSQDRMDGLPDEIWHKIRNGFLSLAEKEKKRWIIIDGTMDVQKIHQQIKSEIDYLIRSLV